MKENIEIQKNSSVSGITAIDQQPLIFFKKDIYSFLKGQLSAKDTEIYNLEDKLLKAQQDKENIQRELGIYDHLVFCSPKLQSPNYIQKGLLQKTFNQNTEKK